MNEAMRPLLFLSVAGVAVAAACGGATTSSTSVPIEVDGSTPIDIPDTGVNLTNPDGASTSVDSGPPLLPCEKHPPGTVTSVVTIAVGATTRSFVLVNPPADGINKMALVVSFHGDGGTGASMSSEFPLVNASQNDAVVIYPDGINFGWDVDHPENETPFFDAILEYAKANTCIDSSRVFVTGYSSGGYMANQLGCIRGDRLRGIAPQSGGGPYILGGTFDPQGNLNCPTSAPSALIIHGDADPTVAPNEGAISQEYWGYRNGCGDAFLTSSPTPCELEDACATGKVGRCIIPGMGHAIWSNAPEAVWTFFKSL